MRINKLNVGSKIKSSGTGGFSFKGSTSKFFENHISKSIPFFKESHLLAAKLSTFFISEDSIVYDLGCSTGLAARSIFDANQNKDFIIYGLDLSKEMIKDAKKKLNKKSKNKIKYILADVLKTKLKKSDLIVSNYFIQFIHPKKRQLVFDKIYKSLNYGGGFIFFEKTRGPDARFQDIFTQIYHEFKHDQGFSKEQIYNKATSIRGVLEPFTSKANVDYMKRAGFKDITSIVKYCSFEGFLAIK